MHAEYDPESGAYEATEITDGEITLGSNRPVGYFFIKETASVRWTATNQGETSIVHSGDGSFNENNLGVASNAYDVCATITNPAEGSSEMIKFTATVEGSGLDM